MNAAAELRAAATEARGVLPQLADRLEATAQTLDDQDVITADAVCKLLRIRRHDLPLWLDAGLPHIRIPGRSRTLRKYRRSTIARWLAERETQSTSGRKHALCRPLTPPSR